MKVHISGYFLSNFKIHGDGTFEVDADLFLSDPHNDNYVEEQIAQELSESIIFDWELEEIEDEEDF